MRLVNIITLSFISLFTASITCIAQGSVDNLPAAFGNGRGSQKTDQRDIEKYWDLVFRAVVRCRHTDPCNSERMTVDKLGAELSRGFGVLHFADIEMFYNDFNGSALGVPGTVGDIKIFYFKDRNGNEIPFIAEPGKDLGVLNYAISLMGYKTPEGHNVLVSSTIFPGRFAELVINQIGKEPTRKEFMAYVRRCQVSH